MNRNMYIYLTWTNQWEKQFFKFQKTKTKIDILLKSLKSLIKLWQNMEMELRVRTLKKFLLMDKLQLSCSWTYFFMHFDTRTRHIFMSRRSSVCRWELWWRKRRVPLAGGRKSLKLPLVYWKHDSSISPNGPHLCCQHLAHSRYQTYNHGTN